MAKWIVDRGSVCHKRTIMTILMGTIFKIWRDLKTCYYHIHYCLRFSHPKSIIIIQRFWNRMVCEYCLFCFSHHVHSEFAYESFFFIHWMEQIITQNLVDSIHLKPYITNPAVEKKYFVMTLHINFRIFVSLKIHLFLEARQFHFFFL